MPETERAWSKLVALNKMALAWLLLLGAVGMNGRRPLFALIVVCRVGWTRGVAR